MSEGLNLAGLPSDVLVVVALASDSHSVLALGATCRMLYGLVKNSIAVQLHLELAAQGLLLNASLRSTRSSAEWYNKLLQTRDNWLNLSFMNLLPLTLSLEDNEMLSVVQGGVFACGASTPGHSDGINRVKVIKLPGVGHPSDSQIPPFASYVPSIISTGRYISAFRISAEQDLVILGALTPAGPSLAIHTLSGVPHPSAKNPTLLLRTTNFIGFAVHDPQPIQIQGDLVSALLTSGSNSVDWGLVIWNWKTGTHAFRKHYVAHALSFTFLSNSSFMLAERDANSTHLTIEDLHLETSSSILRFKLKLPELAMGWNYGPLHFKNDLPPSANVSYQSATAVLPDPDAGVIYLSVGLSGPHLTPDRGPMPHLGLFIGRGALLRKYPGRGALSCEPLVLDWTQWGESVTRWVDVGQMPGLLPAVHGSRYVQVVRQPHSPKAWLQVLDFSLSAVHREQGEPIELRHLEPVQIREASTSYGRLSGILPKTNEETPAGTVLIEVFGYDRPTVLDMPGAFLHPVVSRLPYRCATQFAAVRASSEWMIDGELLFRVDEPEEGKCCMVYPYRVSDRSGEVDALNLG
ncbi:transport protein YPL264C [Ceratobasidium sp. AG-Ba]|nr:transport protein YPL264C [Ceratobasidium sp. AG-Ba]